MSRASRYAIPLVAALIILANLALRLAPAVQPDPVRDSLQRAVASGAYSFSANVVQERAPVASPVNAGRASEQQAVYLEGRVDLRSETTNLRMGAQAGDVASGDGSVELRIDHGSTSIRQDGGMWEEYPGASELYAPGGDVLGYLTSVRDVRLAGAEPRDGETLRRYAFRLDGPAFAEYMRDRQQEALVRQGKLPPGVTLTPSEQHRQLSGSGELWLGDDGLPVRQLLVISLPGEAGQGATTTRMTVDFSDYGPIQPGLPFAWRAGLWASVGWLKGVLPQGLGLLLCALIALVLVRYRGARWLMRILAPALIVAMVVGPLAQSTRVHAFQEESALAAERLRHQQEAASAPAPVAQPSLSPAQQAAQTVANVLLTEVRGDDGRDSDGDGLSDAQELALGTNPQQAGDAGLADTERFAALQRQAIDALDIGGAPPLTSENGADSDQDGLSDYQEQFLSTSPLNPDSDGDSLGDYQEASGFDFGGRRWHTNPLALDSNNDGVVDSMEVKVGAQGLEALNTDGDAEPNAFDRDDDSDGVPDSLDLSPLQHSQAQGAFRDDNPLWLKLDSLSPGKMVAVDFQIRPQNPRQLWYAMSKLDWPADTQGQVQDRNNSADDMQFVPMLEIVIPANSFSSLPSYTKVLANGKATGALDSAELQAQGVSLRQVNDNSIAAYVPLTTVTDRQTGERVAFAGRMLYRGTASWGTAHRVSLVWVVQMRNDEPNNGKLDSAGVVHVYTGEPWLLTGMQLREDHSIKGALIYVDPAAQPDPARRDDTLLTLIGGLERTYLSGRPDLTNDEIVRRFNRTSNGGVSDIARWSVPNELRAEAYSYDSQLNMARDLTGKRNQEILNTLPVTSQPTLLNVRNERFRALNLDSLGSNASWAGHQLTMNLPPSGPAAVAIQTTAIVSLASYEFTNGKWAALPADRAVQAFASRQQPRLTGDDDYKAGQLVLIRNCLAVLFQSVMALVSTNDSSLLAAYAATDAAVAQANASLAKKGPGFTQQILNLLGVPEGVDGTALIRQLGYVVKGIGNAGLTGAKGASTAAGTYLKLTTSLKGKVGYAIAGALIGALAGGLVLAAACVLGDVSPQLRDWIYNGGLNMIQHVTVQTALVIKAGAELIMIVKFGLPAVTKAGIALAVLGAAVSIGFTIGLAIYEACTNDLSAGMIAQLVIATVLQVAWTIFLTVLIFVPKVGLILVLLITIFDAVASVILSLILGRAETFSSWVFKQIARLIIDEARYFTIEPKLSGSQFSLLTDSLGMSAANTFRFSVNVAPNLKNNPDMIGNRWSGSPWSLEQARARVSVNMELAQTEKQLETYVGWPPLYPSHALRQDFTFPAGLNRSTAIWLNSAYNIPFKQCSWWWCNSYDEIKRHNIQLADRVVFDIFPNTLDAFFTLADRAGGKGLAWDGAFTRLPDADFDGVASASDPNDATWDADGDGLADAFEIQRRAEGVAFSERSADSDSDGLSDLQEQLAGTSPAARDSDGDGLGDAEESAGFPRVFGARTLLIRTSPLAADSDGDGVGDRLEIEQTIAAPLAGWRLDEAAGQKRFADYTGGVGLSCQDPSCPQGARLGGRSGARFDGSNDVLSAGADGRYKMSSQMSFAAWVYPTGSGSAAGTLLERDGEYAIYRSREGTLAWSFAALTTVYDRFRLPWGGWYSQPKAVVSLRQVDTRVALPKDRWTHVALTYASGTVTTYLDGVAVHTDSGGGASQSLADMTPGANDLRLGGGAAGSQSFMGLMANAQLFARALSAGEVKGLSGGTTSVSAAQLAAATEAEAAIAPIGVFPSVDDSDMIVRPGQTLGYTVTLRHNLLDGRPIRGSVWVNLPAAPGGGSPAVDFELVRGQQRSYQTSVTVPADAGGGPFTIDAAIQYQLGQEPAAHWEALRFARADAGAAPASVALAPAPGWPAPYVQAATVGDRVLLVPARADGMEAALEVGAGADPALACAGGACLVAWRSGATVRAALVRGTAVGQSVELGSGGPPAVASDGTGFLVAWSDGTTLKARRLDGAGAPEGADLTLDAAIGAGQRVALAWANDVYVALYERGPAGQRDIWFARLSATTSPAPAVLSAEAADETAPAIAFSADSDAALAAYLRDGVLYGRQLTPIAVRDEVALLSDGGAPLEYAALSAASDHFVVAGGLRSGGRPALVYQAVAPSVSLLGEQQRFVWDDGADRAPALALACAAGAPCAVAPGHLTAPQLLIGRLGLSLTEGGAGLIANAAVPSSLPLTVDADAPQASVSSLHDGDYLPASVLTGTLIVGGSVSDASPLDLVEVSLDNGPWQPAEGGAAWAYALAMDGLSAGAHSISVRARDAAGNQGPASAPVTFVIDRAAPALAIATPDAGPLRPLLDASGSWGVTLQGSAQDPGAGDRPGSGLREVALRLESASGASSGEQLVTPDAAGNWQLVYRLAGPSGMEPRITPPTGVYTVSLRATDGAGHLAQLTLPTQLQLDATPPELSLGDALADTITQTLTISGLVTDTGSVASGVASLEGAFVPQEQDDVQAAARVRLLFEELAGSQVFFNSAGSGRGASCAGAACPTIEAGGRIGGALRFSPQQSAALAEELRGAEGFTIAAWLWGQGTLLQRGQAGTAGYVELTTSSFSLQGASAACQLGFGGLAGTGWQHLVATYDGAAQTVYLDGAPVATQPCAAGAVPAGTGRLGPGLEGLLDELHLYERALSAEQVGALQRAAAPTWLPATLGSPNASASSWQLATPEGLEGQYVLRLRGVDKLANASVGRDGVAVWRGTIDTAAPRISLSVARNGAGALTRTVISCRVSDFSLDAASVNCPLPDGTLLERSDTPRRYSAPIERQLGLSDKGGRLIGRDIVYTVAGSASYSGPASACDSYGRCADAAASALPDSTAPLDVLISAPAAPRVLTSLAATSIEGAARSADSLRALTIRVGGSEIYSNSWAQGATSEGSGAPAWTPPAEGSYTVEVVATDWAGRQATASADLFVDIAAPSAVAFASPVVTTTATIPSALMLPIEVTDSGVVKTVQASANGTDWIDAVRDGARWLLPIDDLANPDGAAYSFTLRAVDVAGREVSAANQSVTVDLLPPAELQPTLSIGGGQLLAAGDVVRTAAPALRLAWPAGSDGSGQVTFLAGWTNQAEPDLAALSAHPAGAGHHEQVAAEGKVYYAHLAQIDRYGNRRIQTVGPITVDGPNTPDVISAVGSRAQPERTTDTGWMESGCTLVGRNSALARRATATQAVTATQQLYATWDDRALRLTWAGTTWGDSEDLYLYLDTADGGATTASSEGMPGGQPVVSMPEWFAPDYLLRVDDEQHYALLRWGGQTWAPVSEADAFTLWFGNKGQPDYLNLYLPFTTLGLDQPDQTPVQVLAYATEEDSLRLWAVMPANNPLTSGRAVSSPGSTGDIDSFALTNTIYWEGLAPDTCPSEGQMLADLRFTISAEPVGSIYSVFSDENAAVQDDLLDGADGEVDSESLDYIDNDHPPLHDGQVITYTVHYENVGEVDAEGVQAWLINWGSLKLPGGQLKHDEDGIPYYEQFVPLGNAGTIAAGTAGETVFTGVVDRKIAQLAGEYEDWATLDISLHDNSTGLDYAYDWFFLDHPVDITPPEELTIVEPARYMASGRATVSGTVWDESNVPLIELELRGAGQPRRQSCTDPTPADGEWSCEIDLGGLPHGASVELLARATDAAGLTSDWTEPRAVLVDALPPRIELDDTAASRLAGGVIGARTFTLAGRVLDDGEAKAAEVCVDSKDGRDEQCELAELTPAADGERWSYDLPLVQDAEGLAYALSLTAIDAAGNRGQTMRYAYVVDTVAPRLVLNPATANMVTAQAAPDNDVPLGGTVKDGVGVAEVIVRVRWPNGTTSAGNAQISGGQWSYTLPLSGAGEHRVYVEARDTAGNVHSAAPFSLNGSDRLLLPLVVR